VTRLAAWLAGRSARERTLVVAAGATLALGLMASGGLALRDDLAALRARVAAHERDLAAVRRAAAALRRGGPLAGSDAADAPALFARLEAAASDVVGRERIASMTPAAGAVEDGLAEERVALAVRGASLADAVRLLHRLETADPPLRVARLELRKHPDDPAHFDATVEVAELHPAP
jgi:hypothetical protein